CQQHGNWPQRTF
nr:immunoglobulin light chain junction region [Macaca mulatta]MPN91844.1 immunoglobulin light chain junction region [Macaca mulatta]MPN92003.1 immunoglobulin light chain junction region [Macaca mulatta]MPN92771.1 immunoglobulin light chain junction region [Macaca mulatta]MPN96680.1 immunoglobulin light chain junction region [Macaca mulatta]